MSMRGGDFEARTEASVAGDAPPYVEADGHRVLVVQDGTGWVAVVGIPLAAPLGARLVTVRGAAGSQKIEFSVGEKRYASQSLKVAPRHVNLSAKDLARVNRERLRIGRAVLHWCGSAR